MSYSSLFPSVLLPTYKMNLKKKQKKSLLLVISRRVDTHNSLQKAAAFFLTVVAVWSCATSPLKHEVYFCTFSKPFAAQKKKQTQVCLLICSVWQIGEFICTLKWHRVCSTEPDSHPPMTSAFFFFFFKNILLCSLQRPHNKHLLVSQLLVIRSAAVRERCFGSQVGSEADSVNKPLVM